MTPEELKKFREQIGLTQAEFGRMLNYHHPQVRISEFERGLRKIPARVSKACEYLQAQKKPEINQPNQ